MATAESEIEVIPISGLRVRTATQTLLVGSPSPIWLEAGGLTASSLAALHPTPRVTWSIRDPSTARLYTTHADDLLERSVAEGLSVRVVPLKPGVITIDVRVRNMGQMAETRSWDSTLEILGIPDIKTSVEGLPDELVAGDRLAIAVGSTIRLKSLPRSSWQSYSDGSFDITAAGEIKALKPGYGVAIAQHKDDRINVYRETVIHVQVSIPHYCTAMASGEDEPAVRLVMRDSVGRALLAPEANVSAAPLAAFSRRAVYTAHGSELIISGLDTTGAFMTFQGTASGVTVKDEVWVTGTDVRTDRIIATGSWAVCLEGVGWKSPPDVTVYPGNGVSLAVLTRDAPTKHLLRLDRPTNTFTIVQTAVNKMEFHQGEWPATMVPLSIEGSGLSSGPLLCSEEQKYALNDVQVELPFSCRTKAPRTARAVLDLINGQLGCSIISSPITEPSEVELCAEWGSLRTCTKVLLLPPISISQQKISLLNPPTKFTINGHPHALRTVKITPSPGLKVDSSVSDNEISVTVTSETNTCGYGWVNVQSKLTTQEFRVEVERECDVACGAVLGAILSLLKPYLPTLMTIVAVAATVLYVQSRMSQKSQIRMPIDPNQTVLPPDSPPPINRSRTWSRSPYAPNSPIGPIYGDPSMIPDQSFSPNSSRTHSRFL